MNFALSEDQLLFKQTIRKLFDQYGQTDITRKWIDGEENLLSEVYERLAELGATAVTVPEAFDGLGLGMLDLVPIGEELGRAMYPSNFAETAAFVAKIIGKFGNEILKQTFLSAIASGEAVFSIAWLEKNRSYSTSCQHSKLHEGTEGYIVNAAKTIVPITGVTHFLVVCCNEEGEKVLAIVEREQATVNSLQSFDVTTPVADIVIHQKIIAKEHVITDSQALDYGLLHLHAAISSVQVGGMERLVEMTADYAKIREQFGQPIGRFQSVKHRLADMKVSLEIARSLSYYANWAVDTNAPDVEEAVYSARAYCTEVFIKLAEESVQLHGGIGFTEELDCHLYVKRSRFYEHYLGSIADYQDKVADALKL